MKRRHFCRYAILGSVGLIGAMVPNPVLSKSHTKAHYQWVVLYWMPYDNDLMHFGELIVDMMLRGTTNPNVAVVVQSDYWGDPCMRRRWLAQEAAFEMAVTGDDSSDVLAFSTYLDWAQQSFEAEHWVVIIVGHGGKINEISPDDHGDTDQLRTWMKIDQLAKVVSRFNRATQERVELLFLQNCNKATLEVMYEVRTCARYTLASQMALGAPNYYYQRFLNRLTKDLSNGREAAIAVIESEQSDMYHTLTLVDNRAISLLPNKLSRLMEVMLNSRQLAIVKSELITYHYFDEQHCDVMSFFSHIVKGNFQTQYQLAEFDRFLRSSIVAHHQTGGKFYRHSSQNTDLAKLCGLGLYLPEMKQSINRYQSLSLYQHSRLLDLFKELFI